MKKTGSASTISSGIASTSGNNVYLNSAAPINKASAFVQPSAVKRKRELSLQQTKSALTGQDQDSGVYSHQYSGAGTNSATQLKESHQQPGRILGRSNINMGVTDSVENTSGLASLNSTRSDRNAPQRGTKMATHQPYALASNMPSSNSRLKGASSGQGFSMGNAKSHSVSSSGQGQGQNSSSSLSMSNFNEGQTQVQKPLVREFKTQVKLNKAVGMAQQVSQQSNPVQAGRIYQKAFSAHSQNNQGATKRLGAQQQQQTTDYPSSAQMPKHNQQITAAHRQPIKRLTAGTGAGINSTPATAKQRGSKLLSSGTQSASSGKQPVSSKSREPTTRSSQLFQTNSAASKQSAGAETMIKSPKSSKSPKGMLGVSSSSSSHRKQDLTIAQKLSQQSPTTKAEAFAQASQSRIQPLQLQSPDAQEHIHMHPDAVRPRQDTQQQLREQQQIQLQKEIEREKEIDRNEELMSLLACLNEQAIKELSTQQDQELETGQQRLLKAYKIMVETKNPNSFDANYKAIICYNLACCCQMQGELPDCATYLTRSIEFVKHKLDSLKAIALAQYQANNISNKSNSSNSHIINSTFGDNQSVTAATTNAFGQKKIPNDIYRSKGSKVGSMHDQDAAAKGKAKIGGTSRLNSANNHFNSSSYKSRHSNQVGTHANYTGMGKQPVGNTSANKVLARRSPATTTNRAGAVPLKGSMSMSSTGIKASDASNPALFNDRLGKKGPQHSSNLNRAFAGVAGVQKSRAANRTGTLGMSMATNSKGKHSGSAIATSSSRANLTGNKQFGDTGTKRNARSNFQTLGSGANGKPQIMSVRQGALGSKAKRAGVLSTLSNVYQEQNWLDCYLNHAINSSRRPSREILERSVHLTRHYCRFVLQLCAVLSQLNEHEKALQYSKTASKCAQELCIMTEILLKDEIKPLKAEVSRVSQGSQAQQIMDQRRKSSRSRKRRGSMKGSSGLDIFDPYNTTSLSKQKTTVSAAQHSGSQTKGGLSSNNTSLVQSHLNQTKDKSSLLRGASGNDPNNTTQTSGIGAQSSSSVHTYFASHEQVKNERESLERIHTFSLKEPSEDFDHSQEDMATPKINNPMDAEPLGEIDQAQIDPLLPGASASARNGTLPDARNSSQNVSLDADSNRIGSGRARNISAGSRGSSVSSNRSCSHYVPEKVQIFTKQMKQTYMIVKELTEIQTEFIEISEFSFKERRDYFQDRMAEKKKLKISFQTFEEMNKLKMEQKYKIKARSSLGIKSYGADDWIFSFNIGNIMHLQALGFDELSNAKIVSTAQALKKDDSLSTPSNSKLLSSLQSKRKGESTDSHQMPSLSNKKIGGTNDSLTENPKLQQALRQYLAQEVSKDQLLYKVLYVIVSYFCIGTELRFLAVLNPQKYSLKDSEIWHAKAIHIASYFLPNDCPLIQHITQSYAKHHLRPKIKRRQEQLASLAN